MGPCRPCLKDPRHCKQTKKIWSKECTQKRMPTSCRGQGSNELSNELSNKLSIPNQGLPVHKFAKWKLGVTSVALNRNLNLRLKWLKSHNLGVTNLRHPRRPSIFSASSPAFGFLAACKDSVPRSTADPMTITVKLPWSNGCVTVNTCEQNMYSIV